MVFALYMPTPYRYCGRSILLLFFFLFCFPTEIFANFSSMETNAMNFYNAQNGLNSLSIFWNPGPTYGQMLTTL